MRSRIVNKNLTDMKCLLNNEDFMKRFIEIPFKDRREAIISLLFTHPEWTTDHIADLLDTHLLHIKQAIKGGFVVSSNGNINWSPN